LGFGLSLHLLSVVMGLAWHMLGMQLGLGLALHMVGIGLGIGLPCHMFGMILDIGLPWVVDIGLVWR
jgi:hypothetical protein